MKRAKRSLSRAALAVILLLISPCANCLAGSDAVPVVRADGISIPCTVCRQFPDGSCEIPVRGELALMECAKAIEILLQRIVQSGAGEAGVRPEELRNYLLAKTRAADTAQNVLVLLARTTQGANVLQAAAGEIYFRYPSVILRLVGAGFGSEAFLDAVQQAAGDVAVPENAMLKAEIALRRGGESVRGLFGALSVVDRENDILVLALWAETLREKGHYMAAEAEQLRHKLLSPANMADDDGFSPAAQAYLQQIIRAAHAEQTQNAMPRGVKETKFAPWFVWAAVLFVLSALVGAAVVVAHQVPAQREDVFPVRDLSADERAELRRLRQYFNLGPAAQAADFAREYHLRAKKLHPDTGKSDGAEFAVLSSRYQRVKELLSSAQAV